MPVLRNGIRRRAAFSLYSLAIATTRTPITIRNIAVAAFQGGPTPTAFFRSTSPARRHFMSSSMSTPTPTSVSTNDNGATTNVTTTTTTTTNTTTTKNSISARILETLDPCVVVMKDMINQYAPLWEAKGGIFSLAQGVVYWDPPPSCQDFLVTALTTANNVLHTYGPADGIPELTAALQHKLATENQLDQHKVMVTVGANQAYMNCVLTCLDGSGGTGGGSSDGKEDSSDTRKAVVFRPYYFNHVMALQMCCGDASVVVGPCSDEGIPDLTWLEDTLQSQPSIDMVTIVNPGNPTGVSLSRELLQHAVDVCAKYHVWLVLDCTYEYFTVPEHQPLATFSQKDASHVIHIFSFSKSYALAGYRCGYVVVHNSQTTMWKNMLKVQDTIPIGPPRLSQVAALGALQEEGAGREWVQTKYATLDPSRRILLDALRPLPRTMGGSGAMYVMGQLPTLPRRNNGDVGGVDDDDDDDAAVVVIQDDVEVCRRLVEEYGIAIIPGSFCGFPGWIRVCYANLPPEKCQQAAARLQAGIAAIVSEAAAAHAHNNKNNSKKKAEVS